MQDQLYAVVFSTGEATVTLETSPAVSQSFNVSGGVSQLSLDLTVGGYISATLTRNGTDVVTVKPDNFTFTDTPVTYNYNVFAACGQSSS